MEMENGRKRRICRLCLGNVEIELEESLHVSAIQMLELCLPEMDLAMCSDCTLCLNCIRCLKEIYVFKMKCLQTEEKLRLYLENCDPQNINLKQIVECVSNVRADGACICRSCLDLSGEFISLQADNSSCDLILKNMFLTCIPEMDLNLLNSPIICTTCVDCLKKFYSFKSKCLQTEEEIFTFKEDTNTQLVNLKELIETQDYKGNDSETVTPGCEVKIELECMSTGEIKTKFPFDKEVKTEIQNSTECSLREKHHELASLHIANLKPDIELTEGYFHFANCGLVETYEDTFEPPIYGTDDRSLPIRLQALSENATSPHQGESLTWHTCTSCSYQSKWRHHLERHKQVHEDQLNHHRSFTCFKCGFVTKYKHALLRHSTLEHGDWFKCGECDYQTKWKRCFNQHLLNHGGGQSWHHCELCPYKTIRKYHLKRHMVTHQ